MNKIIVPVDFSEYSEFALEMAAMLAKKYDTEILALHMLEMSDAYLTTTDQEQMAKAAFYLRLAENKFNSFLNKDFLKGVKIIPVVKHFKVFKEIAQVAADHSVDLIVMGSHGTSADSGMFAGSNAEKVVRHSEIPVLVVKSRPTSIDFKDIIYVSDFADESIESYRQARKFFRQLQSNVHLLYVNVPNNGFRNSYEIEERVSSFLDIADGNQDFMSDVNYISDYTVEKGVFNFANQIDADLISIPTHGRTGFSHVFRGSITEDIANHSVLPVLTFRI
ncbi:Nucleotide-binding universal stress protein, UspA family [Flavobacteriaceae bacterium MAR_2010_188]|nr:Nucleotide-binding universal stress protein, UspA family [Flavobacteriaceae bacterium MAR_2010_188]